jgi:hypothetical protein
MSTGRTKAYHPFSEHKSRRGKIKEGHEFICIATEWIKEQAEKEYCVRKNGQVCSCQCLKPLQNELNAEAVAEYLWSFIEKAPPIRKAIVVDMIRYQSHVEPPEWVLHKHCKYRLPYMSELVDVITALNGVYVCQHTLMLLLGLAKDAWRNHKACAETGQIPDHPLLGRRGNRSKAFDRDIKEDLHEFFEHLKRLAEPRATRQVREDLGGSHLKDDDPDIVDLPPYLTKRELYKGWCHDRGWTVHGSHKSNYTYKERNDEKWVGSDGEEKPHLPRCSWATFRTFWRREYPKIRIRNTSSDICDECKKYNINMRQLRSKMKEAESVGDDDDDENDDDDDDDRDAMKIAISDDLAKEMEKVVMHVNEAKSQREFANLIEANARQDEISNVPHRLRRRALLIDYAQNGGLPNLCNEQAGCAYYYSPLTLFIFGIVFIMASGYHLYAHVYSEDKGKKGGNNVVSMLHAQLKQLNLLREDETGGELTIIADNCGGQNKNNFLLRYIVYLVERKFYKKVRVLFLVAGHTKNHCDRHFNLMKVRYRKSNVFDMKGALETLGHVEEHVTALEADEFHKWGDLLDELYNKLGNINKWHNFDSRGCC